jgi:hypothetical protein
MVENTWKTRLTKVTLVNCQFSFFRTDAHISNTPNGAFPILLHGRFVDRARETDILMSA